MQGAMNSRANEFRNRSCKLSDPQMPHPTLWGMTPLTGKLHQKQTKGVEVEGSWKPGVFAAHRLVHHTIIVAMISRPELVYSVYIYTHSDCLYVLVRNTIQRH